MTLEARCLRCRETFLPADLDDLTHGMTEAEEPCGGPGVILGAWGPNAEATAAELAGLDERTNLDGLDGLDRRSAFELLARLVMMDPAGLDVMDFDEAAELIADDPSLDDHSRATQRATIETLYRVIYPEEATP